MRITSKGQITIPQHIREQAGLLPMTEVEFAFRDGVVTLRAAPPDAAAPNRGMAIARHLRGRLRDTRERMTTDEIMALTRGAPTRGAPTRCERRRSWWTATSCWTR